MMRAFSDPEFQIVFPDILDGLRSEDANYEMAMSNSIQPLNLLFYHQRVVKNILTIFMSTNLFPYRKTREMYKVQFDEMAEQYKMLLHVTRTHIYENLSKS